MNGSPWAKQRASPSSIHDVLTSYSNESPFTYPNLAMPQPVEQPNTPICFLRDSSFAPVSFAFVLPLCLRRLLSIPGLLPLLAGYPGRVSWTPVVSMLPLRSHSAQPSCSTGLSSRFIWLLTASIQRKHKRAHSSSRSNRQRRYQIGPCSGNLASDNSC